MQDSAHDKLQTLAASIDACMTDEAYINDHSLRALISMSEDAYIPLDFFQTKPPVAVYSATIEEMAEAVRKYCTYTLELDDSQTRVSRLKPFEQSSRKDALTPWSIYVENLKPPYHTPEKIRELFETIDPVHHVYFPETLFGDQNFHGFCFVEFQEPQSVHRAVRVFDRFSPKSQVSSYAKDKDKAKYVAANTIADKLDLRVMTKIDWEKMKDKYLAQQQGLRQQLQMFWDELNGVSNAIPKRTPPSKPDHTAFITDIRGPRPQHKRVSTQPSAPKQEVSEVASEKSLPYDQGVVVHVDKIQPRTNKTVLKKLFETSKAAVAFINFKKDIPSCDVRLSSPQDAQKLVSFFNNHAITQLKADDAIGTKEKIEALEPLKLRILAGKEEEIYWETQERKQVRYSEVRQTRASKRLHGDQAVNTKEEDPTSMDSEITSKAVKQPKKRARNSDEPKPSDEQTLMQPSSEQEAKTKTASKKKAKKSQGSKKSKNQHVHFPQD
ncbi:hypothetical protein NQZ79_g2460 [Umbelopsis isabellina]|nr:hypothetical protein NQZ79_g2460 [Umbelopsis isabellina]